MQPNQQLTTTDGTVLDPKVLKVMKAIKQLESSGQKDPYSAVGDSGAARGAFQYNDISGPGWKNIARQYLGDENAPMDAANQNKATYFRIKDWKDNGYNGKPVDPEEIAALWNGATKGRDGRYICNNPEYCQRFREAIMGSQQASPIGNTQFQTSINPQSENGVLSALGTAKQQMPEEPGKLDFRLKQGGEALAKLATGVAEGDISQMSSGVLRTGGALAGGALDLVNAGLNAATFGAYDAGMDFIGKKVIAPAFKGVGGDKVIEGWQQLAQEQPELAKNIAALGNIVSAIPVFNVLKQGVSAGTGAISSGIAQAGFMKTAEEATKAELKNSAGTTLKGKGIISAKDVKGKEIDPVDTIVDKDYLPDVVEDSNGIPRYNTDVAMKKVQDNLDLDDELLDKRLQEAMLAPLPRETTPKIRTLTSEASRLGYYPITAMRKDVDEIIRESFKKEGKVSSALKKAESILDDYEGSYGGYIPLTTLREMKSGVRAGVKYGTDSDQALDKEVRKQIGRLYMDKIEEMAKERGIPDVAEISGRMKADIDAMEALKFFNGRSVVERPGLRTVLGRKSGDVATIAGEAVGQATIGPGIGAATGRYISNRAISGTGKSAISKLKSKRTRKLPSKLQTGLALGALLQSSNQEVPPEQI